MRKLIKGLFILSFLLPFVGWNQSYNPFYASLSNSVVYDSVALHMTEFTNFGVKEIGTQALDDIKNWIISKYQSWGYTDIVEDPFTYIGLTTANVVVTKVGTVYPNTYVIIDAHYDTKNGVGSNDNGTGTSILLEIARILQNVQTEYSIKFIHFSGEEDGLKGSQHYVSNTVIPQNLDIKVLFNIDEVGGVNGAVNNTIVCERDQMSPTTNDAQSAAMTDILASCMEMYSSLLTEIAFAYASDYIPFQNNGEIITGLYEKVESPYAHTAPDILSNLDMNYVVEVCKGALGAASEYAVAIEDLSVDELSNSNELWSLFPNPMKNEVNIQSPDGAHQEVEYSILSTNGFQVASGKVQAINGMASIDLHTLEQGTYFLQLKTSENNSTLTLIKSTNGN